MFFAFFLALRDAKLKVSLREFLVLQDAMLKGLADYDVEQFYYLSRATLVKDERHLDAFDKVFAASFKGIISPAAEAGLQPVPIPDDWLRLMAEKHLTAEEKAQIEALGGFDKLMETLRQRLEEQKGRHEGGSKWIGTAGTSAFGANGYNPEGVRIGQDKSRQQRAARVWDERHYKSLAGDEDLGPRNFKIALRRLRRFAREGAAEELDLPGTITQTARTAGYLDLAMRPERHNAVKVLLLLDHGGSMDEHVRLVEQLFAAAGAEFKHLRTYYFHNCPYQTLYTDARMRAVDAVATQTVLHTCDQSWKLIFVGDAAMSPYELLYPDGSAQAMGAGQDWLTRLISTYPKAAWLNPLGPAQWPHTQTIRLIQQAMGGRMFPLTLAGLETAMRGLMQ
jgi:uncharacterized protein with von Willebrand factor type A (vWA) domain